MLSPSHKRLQKPSRNCVSGPAVAACQLIAQESTAKKGPARPPDAKSHRSRQRTNAYGKADTEYLRLISDEPPCHYSPSSMVFSIPLPTSLVFPGDQYMFNPRELATVLAALRLWQRQLRKHGIAMTNGYPQFLEERPLSVTQIDRLCEQLNEPATQQLASSLAVDRCD